MGYPCNADPFWFDKANWPLQRGFDSYYGTLIGVGDYFDPFTLTRGNDPVTAAPPANFYYTDAITDEAVRRIAGDAKADRPFFLYVAYTAPHWPLHARPEDITKYQDNYRIGWDEPRRRRHRKQLELGVVDRKWELPPREPEARVWDAAPDHDWQVRHMAVYAAQIDRLDQGVGRILRAIEDAKVADNTIVLFLSDNGGCQEDVQPNWFDVTTATRTGRPVRVGNQPGQRRGALPGPEEVYQSYGPSWANASNTPFRRYKHFAHEGGIAAPFIARWPAGIPDRGTIRPEVGHVIDLMPTLLELAGGSYPATFRDRPVTPAQGVSLVAALRSRPHAAHPPLFWEHEGNRAVRAGDWKLVAEHGKPWELYDLAADRSEVHDLAGKRPEKVRELGKRQPMPAPTIRPAVPP